MSNSEHTLRTLSRPEILPRISLVIASLAASGWLAGFAVRTGSDALMLAALGAVLGPLVGLKYIDTKARELEDDDDLGDEPDLEEAHDGPSEDDGELSDEDAFVETSESAFEPNPVDLDDEEVSDAE